MLPNATKKSSSSKNCFVYQNSKNDNSIRLPSGEEKPPKVPFNGLYLKVLFYFFFIFFFFFGFGDC
ncbi:hypothetical protein B0A70_15225 [Chryseobacterium piscicola]|uniref:Uncharacterized protein n=1 Tax=Chryseobacterium piscicola TaxID=551459 RepID=A0A2S7KBF7_9FLAO|nr:hypothetical protein B0A70_15225 [Chryseobacterium piscicola]